MYISVPYLLCRGMTIIKLQNKIIRIIINSNFLASSAKLYTETSNFQFTTLVKYRIG